MLLAAISLALLLISVAAVLGSVTVTYAAKAYTEETLPENTGSAPDATRKVTHSNYDEAATLNAGTTPPARLIAAFLATLNTGALTIDLRALTGTNGAEVDGNGLKVQILRVKNLGANPLTIAEGANNGYSLFGSGGQLEIPAGGHFMFFFNDASPDIAAGDKEIDLTGTGAQTSEWTIIMG